MEEMPIMSVVHNRGKGARIPISDHGYREMFESNPLPMWVYDSATLRFLAVNTAAIRTYGYSRAEFLRMGIPDLLIPPPSNNGRNPDLAGTHANIGQHRKKSGTFLSVEVTRYPIEFEGRSAIAEISKETVEPPPASHEVEAQNQELESRVRNRTGQLEAINRELEAFCYSVSHDLRAPLRSIRGFSEVLLERYGPKVDARGQELLRRVCESSQGMDRLIEDLLKLSRVTRVELQRGPVNLSKIAESIIRDLRESEPSRNVQFSIAPDLTADGDERLLHVALDNLVRNAWKFTQKKADARIAIGSTGGHAEKVFFVKDNGAGFDMKYAEKLFGVFQRLHSPQDFPGTGVGLAIVQRIVARHEGRVWATAQVDQGATFYFTLKLEWS
jgi:PAS domain S-box-containing protein